MKKLVAFALLFNAFMFAGQFWQELEANAGTERCSRLSGDVNGDDKVELIRCH
jgi:hypothetical protein